MAVITRVQNTTSPNLRFSLKRKDASGVLQPINLSGSSVDCLLYLNGALVNSGHTLCQVVDAVNGLVLYDLQLADTATAGTYTIDLNVTFATGETEIQPKQQIMLVRSR